MAGLYFDTPRTEAADFTRLTNANGPDFSIEESFRSPSKNNDDLLKHMRNGRAASITTPRSRNPLAGRKNPPGQSKNEFTPLLKSAMKNRIMSADFNEKENGIKTPAALKNGYRWSSPALPEASSLANGESTTTSMDDPDGTPVPPVASSSMMSTPHVILPNRGEGPLDGGNVLTLREQEAVSRASI